MTDDAKKLAELKVKRAALQAAREAKAEKPIAQQIAEEERALREEEAIKAAIDEHGEVGKKIAFIPTNEGLIIVKRPNTILYRQFTDKGDLKVQAQTQLVRPCVVYPSKDEFDQILEAIPATLYHVFESVCILAGARTAEQLGK